MKKRTAGLLLLALWLGVSQGRLALWQTGSPGPVAVFDIWVASLPEYDQRALAAGVEVADVEALFRRLEDYS